MVGKKIMRMFNELDTVEGAWAFEALHETLERDIIGCEVTPSTYSAKCILCKRMIAKGTPRTWVMGKLHQPPPDEGIKKIRRFICHKCSKTILETREKKLIGIIDAGEIAKVKLKRLREVKNDYNKFKNDKEIMEKIKNDEIIQELEQGGENHLKP